jgi:predicted AAA+ superfamily ATPase
LGNESARFQYSKAAKGARSATYASALDWLLAAGMLHKTIVVKKGQKPLEYYADNDTFKLYMNDVGILSHQLGVSFNDVIFDNLGQAKGLIAENYVACEMVAKGVHLHYWRSPNTAEVDLVLENSAGVIPVEIKAGDNVRAKSLKVYCDTFKPPYSVRISTKNFGFENGIKSIPLYAAFCLDSLDEESSYTSP